jgi:hypothetical protein
MTLANAPLWLETARVLKVICPTARAEYFCKWEWTGVPQNSPTGKSPGGKIDPRSPQTPAAECANKKRDGIAPVAFQLL